MTWKGSGAETIESLPRDLLSGGFVSRGFAFGAGSFVSRFQGKAPAAEKFWHAPAAPAASVPLGRRGNTSYLLREAGLLYFI